jgi:mitochondrial fission protein ELM1
MMTEQNTQIWVLSDGKVGDEAQCFGLAEALGAHAQRRLVTPRGLFALFMPYGPIDPREGLSRPDSPLAPPFPDIAIAAGRRTVAYLRALKRASRDKTFTVFVKDPYLRRRVADFIWVPQHDRLRGKNIFVTSTPPHRMSPRVLENARRSGDPRLAGLKLPRLLLSLGGRSQHHDFSSLDQTQLLRLIRHATETGFSIMVTGSRRTPGELLMNLENELITRASPHFVWDGSGENPYAAMLASAARIVVTGDSVNMMAEAVATGVPVSIYEPTGGHPKITAYIDALVAAGAARRWNEKFESWTYEPIDATPVIAREIARRYAIWRDAQQAKA